MKKEKKEFNIVIRRIAETKWFNYTINTLHLIFILGLCIGVILGIIRGWNYASKGFFLPVIDSLVRSINESIIIVSLFIVLYMFIFLVLSGVIKNTKWTCFVSSAISCLPFFLLWAYGMNKAHSGVGWSNIFDKEVVVLNLKIGSGFVLLWLLISIGLLIWTGSRILKAQSVNLRLLGSTVGMVLVLNISIYLFYNFHKVKQDSPNVVILLVDCLRADHLSSYGYGRKTTPNIDEFSKDAVIYTQAISQSTFTKTSIASLFTSLYPYQHGIYMGAVEKNDDPNLITDVLGEEETTLAEVLLQNGFLTVAWTKFAHLAPSLGFAQGFIEYDSARRDVNNIKSINKKFMKWAKRIGKKGKFFAYIHYDDLHGPYLPQPPYSTLYLSEISRGNGESTLLGLEKNKALYDGQLTYIDTQIGLLLRNLKKEGLYENTLVILTADHGEGFGEHGIVQHSQEPYDVLIRVPLIIKFPESLHAGTVITNQVRLIDIMPTILDFVNIRTDSELQGFSLLNYLNNKKDKPATDFPKYAISELSHNQRLPNNGLSIRTEKFKYIHLINKEDELYDLETDPKEQNNIIKLRPKIAEEFRNMLSAILAQSEKNRNRTKKVTYEKQMIKDLKALGYIQ